MYLKPNLLVPVLVGCLVSLPTDAGAFGNSIAHPHLAEGAFDRADADLSVHDYFRDVLSFEEGGSTRVDLRLGFDADIDREVRLERFLDPKTGRKELAKFVSAGLQFRLGIRHSRRVFATTDIDVSDNWRPAGEKTALAGPLPGRDGAQSAVRLRAPTIRGGATTRDR